MLRTFDVEVRRETSLALLVYFVDLDEEVWIPKSVIHDDSEVFDSDDNSEGEIVLKDWFCDKEWLQ